MVVPENRGRADSRSIALPVAIFRANGKAGAGKPLVFINGGPGYRVGIGHRDEIASWWEWVDHIPAHHDVIIVGLRGTGLEAPDFNCPELVDPRVWAGATEQPGSKGPSWPRFAAAAVECWERLLAEGVDLTAYNSRETAADLEDLRLALGIEAWSLYGISYGTRIALTVMRHHPEGLESVILDSVFPPQAPATLDYPRFYQASLNRLFGDCRKVAYCRRNFPRLDLKFEELRLRLAEQPEEISVGGMGAWPKLHIRLDDVALLEIVHHALYWWDLTDFLPMAIDQASIGDFMLIEMLAAEYYVTDEPSFFSPAVALSYVCHEEAPFETEEQRAQAIRTVGRFKGMIENDPIERLCPMWPAGQASAIEDTPVKSLIPTLLLAGSYDPVTPIDLARQAAETLEKAYVFEFRNVGHAVFDSHPCARTLVTNFLADPSRKPDAVCLDHIGLPGFGAEAEGPPSWIYAR